MGYTSFFAGKGGNGKVASPTVGGGSKGGYKSFFGTSTVAEPSADDLTALRAQQAQQAKQQADAQAKAQADANAKAKQGSIFNKVVKVAKAVGSGAITSEKTAATGIARVLPGGTNDLKAEQQATEQASKNQKFIIGQEKAGKINKPAATKIIKANADSAGQANKELNKTVKAMPTKGQLAAGFAGTAADIATGGTFGAQAKGAEAAAKAAETAAKTSKAAKVVKVAKREAPLVAGNAASGGFNAASGGGDKKSVVKNALLGAAFPEVLNAGGVTAANGISKLAENPKVASLVDKVKTPAVAAGKDKGVNNFVTQSKTQSLLSSVKNPSLSINARVNPDHVEQGLVKPDITEIPASKLSISADAVTKTDASKVNQYVKQIKDGEPIEPVVVQHINGQTFVVDGQQRLAAAQKLGIENIPTVEKAPGPVKVGSASATKPAQELPGEAKPPATQTAPAPVSEKVSASPATVTPAEGSMTRTVGVAPHAPDSATIKEQIKNIKSDEKNYDSNGYISSDAAKQVQALNKQLNAAGVRVPQSKKPVTFTPVESTPRVESANLKTAKLAQGVEANAVKKGLTEGFADKSEYAAVNIPQQAQAAADLLKSDPERAVRIAMGHEKPPESLLPESVFIAVEKAATKSGDADLIKRLATESHLTSEASGLGQRIRMLGERDSNSAVSNIKQVADARAAAAEKRLGKPVTKAVNDEVKQIRAAKPKVTKETWGSFIDSLKC